MSAAQPLSLEPVLVTIEEAADALRMSKRAFEALCAEPFMPRAIILGPRTLRYSLNELRAAVASMPRQMERVQPESLLRAKIERMKATGASK